MIKTKIKKGGGWLIGLDNGLYVKNYPDEFLSRAPSSFNYWKDDSKEEVEFAYWRKCWSLRDEIMAVLPEESEEGHYELTIEILKQIRNICIKYMDPEYYKVNSLDMLWTYEEFDPSQKENIKNIVYVIDSWGKFPEMKVYFYDSY